MNDGAAGMTGTIKARSGPLVFTARRGRPLPRSFQARDDVQERQSSERNAPEASMPMTTTMPTFDQRVERALQNLCAHEAGHFVVAQHFGAACHAHIWKSFDPGASPNAQEALIHQKRYDGMCEYYDGNLSLRQNRCFSVAGAVAEIVMRSNRNDEDGTTERLNSSEIWDCMSPSDREPFLLDPNGGCDEHALLDAVKRARVLLEGVLAGEWRDATEALALQALAGEAQNRIVGHEIWAVCLNEAGATLETEGDL